MNNNDNNRVNDQIKQQQINNQLEQRSNLSKGMAPYQHYKKTHVKSSIDDNKRMKNQLNSVSRKGSSSLGGLGGTVNRGVNAANDYKNATTVKDKEKAKSQMKGSVANGAVTAATGSSTLGNLAEKAVKMKDKLNPLKAAKNAILGKINGDEEEQYDELGNPKQQENRLENVSFTIPPKVIKWTLIAGLPSFVAIIFIVLFVTASQTYINILGIDSADKVTEEQLESKDDTWHEEGEGATDPNDVAVSNYNKNIVLVDSFIEESSNVNIVLVANERTHEADLGDINDYFSKKLKCEDDKCQEEPEYLFYLKMHDIYYLYKIKYKVILDLPLLMSSLSIGDEEIVNIFEMNSKNFTLKDHENNLDYIKKCQEGNCPSEILNIDPAYDFKNLNGYLYLSSSDFSYDMQILAQNMVVQTGDNYKKDLNHFDEFLEQYIEYKYYLSDSKKKELYDKEKENNDENIISTVFKKYDLTEDQLLQIASLCQAEQGTPIGAAAEASLMANRFELSKGTKGTTGNDLYNYIRNSSWWNDAPGNMDKKNASKKVIERVKSVLVDGKRTLPGYIDEHDCIDCGSYGFDIVKILTGNDVITTSSPIKLKSHSSYIKHKTIIYNKYGSVYTFYSFPTAWSDPFGYTNTENRRKIGDFYYDNNGNPIGNVPGEANPNIKGDYNGWKQCSDEWGSISIGNSTICKSGCYVTSIAIQIARSGTKLTVNDFSPVTIAENASFSSGGSLNSYNFSKYAPNFYYSNRIYTSGISKSKVIEIIAKEIEKGNYPVVRVDNHHFVAAIGTTENDITILNPSRTGTNLYKDYSTVNFIEVFKKKD